MSQYNCKTSYFDVKIQFKAYAVFHPSISIFHPLISKVHQISQMTNMTWHGPSSKYGPFNDISIRLLTMPYIYQINQ